MRSSFSETQPACGGAAYCAQVDAMYVEYLDPSRWSPRVALLTGLTSIAPDSSLVIGDVSDWWTNVNLAPYYGLDWWQGIPVDKVGFATGWSRGKLRATCETRTFNIELGPGLTETILCNDVMGPDTLSNGTVNVPHAGGGDSGGPVFVSNNWSNTQLKALGIVVAVVYDPYPLIMDGAPVCVSDRCLVYYNRLSPAQTICPSYLLTANSE